MVVAILGFSWLVSHYLVEPELVLELTRDGMLSPTAGDFSGAAHHHVHVGGAWQLA